MTGTDKRSKKGKKPGKCVKVPVIMQMEMLECGAASLAMILAYHKKWIPLEKVREDCAVSRDGSNAKYILTAAKKYGFTAKAFKGTTEDVKETSFPCIAYWNFNHFVVVRGFSGKYAYLNDPSAGDVKIALNEFERAFSGIYMTFEPGADFEPEGKPKSILEFVMIRLKGATEPIVFVMITVFLMSIIGIAMPVLSRIFIDQVLTGQTPGWRTPLIAGMIFLSTVSLTVSLVNAIYTLKIRGKLAVVSSSTFLWHILRLPMGFFSQRMAGDISGRLKCNEVIAETFVSRLAPIGLNVLLSVFYFAVMVRYSVPMAFIGLLAVAINAIMARVISKRRINITRTQARDEGRLWGLAYGGIRIIETIKSSGAENGFFEKWAGIRAAVNRSQSGFVNVNAYFGAVPELVKSISQTAILIIGAHLILSGKFTAGSLLAFQGFLTAFTSPVESLVSAVQSVQETRVTMERVEDVLKYPVDVYESEFMDRETTAGFDKLTGDIELKNVSFGYNRLAPPLIKEFNMKLKAGSSVALVGPSGCGKSTLAKLISGLYKPWEGEILFDGVPLEDIERHSFTSSVAVVDQDITVFEDTVSDNVRLWDKSVEDFEVTLACRDAGIHEDILRRPDGYKNMMAEGGRNFSGGQRQRLEIARALAINPAVIIMDEATSALDAKTEFDVTNAIRDRGITCVVIAHRLSTIRDCDEIIVIEKGICVERGTHSEMAGRNGFYSRLIATE